MLIFDNFAQKEYFQSKTEKVNSTIEFCIFELVLVQISLSFLIFLKKIYLNSTQAIVKFTSFNISLFENGKCVFDKSSSNNKNLDSVTKNYYEYCTLFGLKRLIKCPARVTCNSSSILDHVLASFPDRFSQSVVIDVGISDHQLTYCTRKTAISKLLAAL